MQYLISNIDGINALEDGRLMIFFRDCTPEIETDCVSFNQDGTFEPGYIFNSTKRG